MLQIKIEVKQIYIRLKINKQEQAINPNNNKQQNKSNKLNIKIYLKQNGQTNNKQQINNKQTLLQQCIDQLNNDHLIKLQSMNHTIYCLQNKFKNTIISMKIIFQSLTIEGIQSSNINGQNKNILNQDNKNKIVKLIGQCQLSFQAILSQYNSKNTNQQINSSLNQQKQKLERIKNKKLQCYLPINKCKYNKAYVKVQLVIKQISQLKEIIKNKLIKQQPLISNQNQQQLTHKQIQKQFKRQQINEKKEQLIRLKQRNIKYLKQINNIKQQNHQLSHQIDQHQQTLTITKQLYEDKLNSINNKNHKLQQTYQSTKQQISQILNTINQYANLDIVQSITNLLTN